MIIMIAAASENNALGKTIGLAFTQRFQKVQEPQDIILWGENIRKFSKPLPNRTHML
jgi:hypothetical protein